MPWEGAADLNSQIRAFLALLYTANGEREGHFKEPLHLLAEFLNCEILARFGG